MERAIPRPPAGWGDKHSGHFAFPVIEMLYRAGADDVCIEYRTQEHGTVTVYPLGFIDVR